MSTDVTSERVTADIDGDFVVFRIGMRINSLWKVHKWAPVFVAMPRMLRELEADPDSGLLGYRRHLGIRNHMLFMYWRSFDDLREYARDPDREHLPAWREYSREIGDPRARRRTTRLRPHTASEHLLKLARAGTETFNSSVQGPSSLPPPARPVQ